MSFIDGFIYDRQVADLGKAASDSVQAYRAALDKMQLANASNLTIRYALAKELQKVDPGNPLLNDKMLRERLMEAGAKAFSISDLDFDAAREVGRTFKIPGRD